MVLLGGLEVLAAGYLIHKHNKNKKERARLEEEAAALEEASYPIFPAEQRPARRHHHHHHSEERPAKTYKDDFESEDERRERRRRRRERREHEAAAAAAVGIGRTSSAPPPHKLGMGMGNASQTVIAPGVVGGWPAHWAQTQVPPRASTPQPPPTHGFPQDVKYGFVPEVPHEQLPPYTEHERHEGRHGNRLEVRGRRERRSLSPNLGVREDMYSRSPARVRFSTEDVVLGEEPARYR